MIGFAQPARKIPASLPEPERNPLIGDLTEDEFDPPAARPYHASRCRPRLTDRVVERRPEEPPITARSKRRLPRPRCRDATASRNRRFESGFLQQTVHLSPDFASIPGKDAGFPPLWRPCGAARSAETRGAQQRRAEQRWCLCRALFQYRSAADAIATARNWPSNRGRVCLGGE